MTGKYFHVFTVVKTYGGVEAWIRELLTCYNGHKWRASCTGRHTSGEKKIIDTLCLRVRRSRRAGVDTG
jgi:hypothetical protein